MTVDQESQTQQKGKIETASDKQAEFLVKLREACQLIVKATDEYFQTLAPLETEDSKYMTNVAIPTTSCSPAMQQSKPTNIEKTMPKNFGSFARSKTTEKNPSLNSKLLSGAASISDRRTWAKLNLEGKREWGDIFPDGKVPVQSVATQQAKLNGIKDAESVLTVAWKELTEPQQQAIIEKLSNQNSSSKDEILKEISKAGLPLRRRYVLSVGTNRMELFF